MLKYLLSFLGIFMFILFNSQTINDIKILKEKHQKCLDKGAAMHICSYNFYNSADELLNKSYQKYRNQLDIQEQKSLKKNQKIWLKRRDSVFKKNFLEIKKIEGFSEDTHDFKMILNDKNANFVLSRVEFLINKIQ